jgi:hypothetical protein
LFSQLHTLGFIDAESAGILHSHVRTVALWALWIRAQLEIGRLTSLEAFLEIENPLTAYVEICNRVIQLIANRHAIVASVPSTSSGLTPLKRDWHGVSTYANELAAQYRQVAHRVNLRLGHTRARVYIETVSQWP